MRFSSLGSGSKGNASLVEYKDACIMFDCGFSFVQTKKRLAKLGKTIDDISAVFISHEHGDHINGVAALLDNTEIPVWATAGTARHLPLSNYINIIDSHQQYIIDDILKINPVVVPHDAAEPCQFVVSSSKTKVGILTDVGHITAHIETSFSSCDALMLETNYDEEMLMSGSYPDFLKSRISSDLGHLSNQQSAGLLKRLDTSTLKHITLMHLSENNNSAQLALRVISKALGDMKFPLNVANQKKGSDWVSI